MIHYTPVVKNGKPCINRSLNGKIIHQRRIFSIAMITRRVSLETLRSKDTRACRKKIVSVLSCASFFFAAIQFSGILNNHQCKHTICITHIQIYIYIYICIYIYTQKKNTYIYNYIYIHINIYIYTILHHNVHMYACSTDVYIHVQMHFKTSQLASAVVASWDHCPECFSPTFYYG